MNTVDFSYPNGFPLEADKTLGFMQEDTISAFRGLAAALGGELVILSGMVDNGTSLTAGWCIIGGDLCRFEAGVKTTNIVVNTTVVQKANQDGTLYDRYFTKVARFGTGAVVYPYVNFVRMETLQRINERFVNSLIENVVILSGMVVSSVNTGASTLQISSGLACIVGRWIDAPAYSGTYPVYLNQQGQWVTTVPPGPRVTFNPYTSERIRNAYQRASSPIGEIKMVSVSQTQFDNTGLGKWEWQGFAICNGANGTVDLRSRFVVGYDNRTTDPGGNLWDTAYQTVGAVGGEKAHTLTIGEMPSHNHTTNTVAGGAVSPGQRGLVRKSQSGENVTASGTDGSGSGVEPDVSVTPQDVPYQGGGLGHENRPPFRVVLFVQRIS